MGIRRRQWRGTRWAAAIALCGCASQPISVIPLGTVAIQNAAAAPRPMFAIHNGIKAADIGAVTPKAWKRANAFCKASGKLPREEQITQQWPPVRDFVFSCITDPERFTR